MLNRADKDFVMDIDEKKSFSEQKISKRAKAIILGLYKKYFINEEQGKKLDQLLKYIESQSKKSISFEDRLKQINESKKEEIIQEKVEKDDKALIEINFFQKFINKIKEMFKNRK